LGASLIRVHGRRSYFWLARGRWDEGNKVVVGWVGLSEGGSEENPPSKICLSTKKLPRFTFRQKKSELTVTVHPYSALNLYFIVKEK
jgi:hypothetical protein